MAALRRALASLRQNVDTINMAKLTSVSIAPCRAAPLYRSHLGSVSHFSSNLQPFEIDLSSEESRRRTFNRLLYRSRQRGFLELDLVLGNYVEEHISSMDKARIQSLVDVLDVENPDLWKWLTGQDQPPEGLNSNPVFSAVRDKVMSNLNSHTSPETRATPGQPWVRGWDDFKKGRDSPISGNQ
ncbi:hypothetical protein GIB67_004154 [Kingdonia uniflora]|uniref:Succinate dehydrogenase assembly factor 2, mitochondrial n=1 Tax=Kingdonia uniflora TaxID=39325 RepID=A0A7J7KVD2_9MAGN|nr:hypothetical protein GIB67_000389 [Kingdonia uniflora]KAF6169762.1 hypothetical protein GIB67_004154 [Kingdonia uniflora]